MKKYLLLIIAVFVFLSAMLVGCGKDKETVSDDLTDGESEIDELVDDETDEGTAMRETLVYYGDDLGYIVPVMLKIPWEEGIAKAALNKMKGEGKSSEMLSMGLNSLLPDKITILGLNIVDGLAKVDFSKELNECSDVLQESNMVQGIVLTLTSFPTIEKVQIMVEGEVIETLKNGTRIGSPINKVDINLEKTTGAPADGSKVTLYFYNTSASLYDYAVPVTRITDSTLATLDTAMNELINGPIGNSEMDNYLPGGITYIGSQMSDGVTYLSFSEEFADLKEDPVAEKLAINSILLTASQFEDITDVVIMVNNEVYDYETEIPTFANVY